MWPCAQWIAVVGRETMAEEQEFYCMKCRKKVKSDKFEKKTLKTKTGERAQLVGICPSCGGKVYKFVKA